MGKTTDAGIWFLSYLCELGYIEQEDDVYSGCVFGSSRKDFMGLKNGTQVYIVVDQKDHSLFHVFHQEGKDDGDDENGEGEDDGEGEVDGEGDCEEEEYCEDDDVWWEKPTTEKFDFVVGDIMQCLTRQEAKEKKPKKTK